ncbi:MAG: hypothetical protein WAM53_15345 [Terrimicrobiaceae bacterium]
MNTFRKYLQFIWVAAILVLVSGQLAHAYQEFNRIAQHCEEQGLPNKNECPLEHQCCNAHSPGVGLWTQSSLPDGASVGKIAYFIQDVAYSGGVLDEIKYPPRLS